MSNPAPLPIPSDDPWADDPWADEDDDAWDDDFDDGDDELVDCWIAHDDPTRPFAFGMWLCDCGICLDALRIEAAARPHTAMVLRTSRDLLVIAAVRLLDAIEHGGVDQLCRDPNDRIREMFVGSRLLQRLVRAQRVPPRP